MGFVPAVGTTACGAIGGETTGAVGTIAPGIERRFCTGGGRIRNRLHRYRIVVAGQAEG
jgi:hypothetical protein